MTQFYGFESKEDMLAQFSAGDADTVDAVHPLFAFYSYEDYSGYAVVLFRDLSDGELYCVEGSHCSCNGLEGQWEPKRITIGALNTMYAGGWPNIGDFERKEFRNVLDSLENHDVNALQAAEQLLKNEIATLKAEKARVIYAKYGKRVDELRQEKLRLERDLKELNDG